MAYLIYNLPKNKLIRSHHQLTIAREIHFKEKHFLFKNISSPSNQPKTTKPHLSNDLYVYIEISYYQYHNAFIATTEQRACNCHTTAFCVYSIVSHINEFTHSSKRNERLKLLLLALVINCYDRSRCLTFVSIRIFFLCLHCVAFMYVYNKPAQFNFGYCVLCGRSMQTARWLSVSFICFQIMHIYSVLFLCVFC